MQPKNGKYEIVLGVDKYQAALIANQKIASIIINYNEKDIYPKYNNVDNNQMSSVKSKPTETFFTDERNSDVANLSELSKIKLEDERDDVIMNNGQLNNNMQNNNVGQPDMNQANQGPAFGGRFFPSLEDEPTNMNMMGGINSQQNISIAPEMNNNLIDLTDLSLEKESAPISPLNLGEPAMSIPPLNSMPLNNFENPNSVGNSIQQNDNIINLESLQNNNPNVQPISGPVSMDILNTDFGVQQPMPTSINMGPNLDINVPPAPLVNEPVNTVQPNFGLNQPPVSAINNQVASPQSVSSLDINTPSTLQGDFGPKPQPVEPVTPSVTLKDVTPVTNTIKNLVTSLASFGFKINVIEEDLPNKTKIVIEVEK